MDGRGDGELELVGKSDVALESIFESAGATSGGSDISQHIAAILDTAEGRTTPARMTSDAAPSGPRR
jgi:hypothetical protein